MRPTAVMNTPTASGRPKDELEADHDLGDRHLEFDDGDFDDQSAMLIGFG